MRYCIYFFLIVTSVCSGYFLSQEFFLAKNEYTVVNTPQKNQQKKVPESIEIDQEQKQISLLFFGDAMFDRWVRTKVDNTTLFDGVQKIIDESDFAILNLEGAITPFASVAAYDNLNFTFPTTTATVLKSVGIDGVSLANNHTGDFGRKGLEYTRSYLDEVGVFHFGDEYNSSSTRSYVLKTNGIEIAFVGYHEFVNPDTEPFLEEIKTHKQVGRMVIFMPHWGNEYKKRANTSQTFIAQKAVEAGADIVIGAHPHVVQNIEVIKNSPVLYSLGNFIFDQFFSYDVKEELAVRITIDPSSKMITILELIPLFREKYIPILIENKELWCAKYIQNSSALTRFFTEQSNSCMLYRAYE